MSNTLKIVEELNEELYEKTKSDNVIFTYTNSGYESISFSLYLEDSNIKINLWNSENSQQIYREETNDYEPLEKTIKRELKIAIDELNKIVKTLNRK